MLVRSDLGADFPVNVAELDALEAFLMPQILALLQEKRRPDSEAPMTQKSASTEGAMFWKGW
jgi:hypothetical protein